VRKGYFDHIRKGFCYHKWFSFSYVIFHIQYTYNSLCVFFLLFILSYYYHARSALWHWQKYITTHHSWINSLHHSTLFSLLSWNSFNRSHFSIFIPEYIIFPLYSPSYTLSLYFHTHTDTPPPRQDLFCLPVLSFWKKYILFVYDSYTRYDS
jgi:hypothetical protein